jgi:hypothetical protein
VLHGRQRRPNKTESLMWLKIAADNGNQDARKFVRLGEREMLPEEIAAADQAAREWRAKHQR